MYDVCDKTTEIDIYFESSEDLDGILMFEDSGSYYIGPNIEYEILVA